MIHLAKCVSSPALDRAAAKKRARMGLQVVSPNCQKQHSLAGARIDAKTNSTDVSIKKGESNVPEITFIQT
jgi:hypothetical protein